MTESKQSHTLSRLAIDREGRAPYGSASAVEAEVLESVARVLKEALANGVVLRPSGTQLSREELRSIYRDLAAHVWQEQELAGESPVSSLHREHNGWGPPLDGAPDHQGNEHKLPWPILAMDVIDFLWMMMGPGDTLRWEGDEP